VIAIGSGRAPPPPRSAQACAFVEFLSLIRSPLGLSSGWQRWDATRLILVNTSPYAEPRWQSRIAERRVLVLMAYGRMRHSSGRLECSEKPATRSEICARTLGIAFCPRHSAEASLSSESRSA
jgi:hypothetical protein